MSPTSGRRKSGRRARATPAELRKTLRAAMRSSASGSPSPGDIAGAVARVLDLDACVVYERRHGSYTALASNIRTPDLREALTRAYLEQHLTPEVGGRVTPARAWAKRSGLPDYMRRLLTPRQWTLDIPLRQGAVLAGTVWLLGDSDRHPPPDAALREVIADAALSSLREALGLAYALPEADEVKLLEELGTVLSEARPLQERLADLVRRASDATGFMSVQLITRTPADEGGVLTALYTRDLGPVTEPEWLHLRSMTWAKDHFGKRPGPLLLPNPDQLPNLLEFQRDWMRRNNIRFLLVTPLFFGEEFLGVFQVCSPFQEDETWRRGRIFTALGGNVAAVLRSVLLLDQVEDARQRLYVSHQNTVRTLAQAAEARDMFTGGHLRRLESYARALGARLGLSNGEIENLALGAVVHDIGKLRVPDAVLLKPARLDEHEQSVVRQHPLYGESILSTSSVPEVAVQIARWHHERWDGSGYPDGLRGANLPLEVRIVTVADVFDALTSVRPYKRAWSPDEALRELIALSGSQFDPEVVETFHSLWQEGLIKLILSESGDEPHPRAA